MVLAVLQTAVPQDELFGRETDRVDVPSDVEVMCRRAVAEGSQILILNKDDEPTAIFSSAIIQVNFLQAIETKLSAHT
ncbi:hypothetical protein ACET3Z_001189 [Daucus carota]